MLEQDVSVPALSNRGEKKGKKAKVPSKETAFLDLCLSARCSLCDGRALGGWDEARVCRRVEDGGWAKTDTHTHAHGRTM